MADRRAPTAGPSGINKARTIASSVRRNLFQSQLTRRPTPTGSSSNSTETLRLDVDVLSDTSDIVVRDKNGELELADVPTPPPDDADDPAPSDDGESMFLGGPSRQNVGC
jgi:hypothetical protein